jgi:hypothetical protein
LPRTKVAEWADIVRPWLRYKDGHLLYANGHLAKSCPSPDIGGPCDAFDGGEAPSTVAMSYSIVPPQGCVCPVGGGPFGETGTSSGSLGGIVDLAGQGPTDPCSFRGSGSDTGWHSEDFESPGTDCAGTLFASFTSGAFTAAVDFGFDGTNYLIQASLAFTGSTVSWTNSPSPYSQSTIFPASGSVSVPIPMPFTGACPFVSTNNPTTVVLSW